MEPIKESCENITFTVPQYWCVTWDTKMCNRPDNMWVMESGSSTTVCQPDEDNCMIVLQRKSKGNFSRGMREYVNGFGDPKGKLVDF